MKICKKCLVEKELSQFTTNGRMKDGHLSSCRECQRLMRKKYAAKAGIRSKIWAAQNPEKVKENAKRYRDANKDKARLYYLKNKDRHAQMCRAYRYSHKERIATDNKRRYEKNKERASLYGKEYRSKNREKLKKRKAEAYQRDKYKYRESKNKRYNNQYGNDILFRLSVCLRSRLRQAIKKNSKFGSAVRDLGCSIKQFKNYIESKFYFRKSDGLEMTWENYGKEWQLDHIESLCCFYLTSREQFLRACHYTNLQPLWNEDHFIKTETDMLKRNSHDQ